MADLPEIDAHPDQFEQLGCALQPGDAVAFHMLTLHASSGVGPGTRRRVFSARYLGDDARHAVRHWSTSPPFAGLNTHLGQRRGGGRRSVSAASNQLTYY